MATPFTYGGFNLNDGINYFLIKKEMDFVALQQTYFKIARLEGMKKTGDTVNQRLIDVDIRVLGMSRIDLETQIDDLYQAMNVRGQSLQLHSGDARYFVADCFNVEIEMISGTVLSVIAHLHFIAASPFAYSATGNTFDTGTVTTTLASGSTYTMGALNITGGGTVFVRPQIRIANKTAVTWTQLQVTQLTDSQQITVAAGLPTLATDYIDIFCDPGGNSGFTVQKNSSGTPLAFTGIFPVLEPTPTSFTITINASSAPHVDATFTWTPRWLY